MSRSLPAGKPTSLSDLAGIRNLEMPTSASGVTRKEGATSWLSATPRLDMVSRHPVVGSCTTCASISSSTRSAVNLKPLASTTTAWKPLYVGCSVSRSVPVTHWLLWCDMTV